MKILLLADEADQFLWEHLNKKRLEGIDLILAAGDLPAQYLSFLTCFTNVPIVYVPGNHDGRYLRQPPEGCECADGTIVTAAGLRILGLGGSMRYTMGPYQYNDKEMQKRVKAMKFALWQHGGFDVLLTHAPAYGIGDQPDLCHMGFETFVRLMDTYHPQLMVHGHVHATYSSSFKRERLYGETRIINAFTSYVVEIPDPPGFKKKLPFIHPKPVLEV